MKSTTCAIALLLCALLTATALASAATGTGAGGGDEPVPTEGFGIVYEDLDTDGDADDLWLDLNGNGVMDPADVEWYDTWAAITGYQDGTHKIYMDQGWDGSIDWVVTLEDLNGDLDYDDPGEYSEEPGGLTPLMVLSGVMWSLEDLETGDSKADGCVGDAGGMLATAVDPVYWAEDDGCHLDLEDGGEVFDALQGAASSLEAVRDSGKVLPEAGCAADGAASTVAGAAGLLAVTAGEEAWPVLEGYLPSANAILGNGFVERYDARSSRYYTDATEKVAAGDWSKAIVQYGRAWDQARDILAYDLKDGQRVDAIEAFARAAGDELEAAEEHLDADEDEEAGEHLDAAAAYVCVIMKLMLGLEHVQKKVEGTLVASLEDLVQMLLDLASANPDFRANFYEMILDLKVAILARTAGPEIDFGAIGDVSYNPGFGEGVYGSTDPSGDIEIGPDAFNGVDDGGFSQPFLLGVLKHEAMHATQAGEGRWYVDSAAPMGDGNTNGDEINEIEADDAVISEASDLGLSDAELDLFETHRADHYGALDDESDAGNTEDQNRMADTDGNGILDVNEDNDPHNDTNYEN